MIKSRLRGNTALALVSLLLSIIVLELAFRGYMASQGDSIDDITQSSWYPAEKPDNASPGIKFKYGEAYYEDGLNDIALNDLFYREYMNTTGKYRILILGDSVTIGTGLDNESKWFSSILSEDLGDGYHIFNMGLGGASLDYYQLASDKYFEGFEANLTIIAYFPNDIDSDAMETSGWSIAFLDRPARRSALAYFAKRSLENLLNTYLDYYIEVFNDPAIVARHESSLNRLITSIRESGSGVMIVSIPFLYQLDSFNDYPLKHEEQLLNDISVMNNVTFVSVYPYLSTYRPEELQVNRFDHHPNEMGHMLIAKAIYRQLAWMNVSP